VATTCEVSQITNDCLLLAKIDNFVIKLDSSQTGHWKRRHLLCVLYQSVAMTTHVMHQSVTMTTHVMYQYVTMAAYVNVMHQSVTMAGYVIHQSVTMVAHVIH